MDNREGATRVRGAPARRVLLPLLAGAAAGMAVSLAADGTPSVLVSLWVAASIPVGTWTGDFLAE